MQVGTISIKTADAIRKVAWTVKQAHEQFVQVYRQAFTDCCGAEWEKEWQDWPDFEEIVEAVEMQIKAICIEAGMPKSTWTKYTTGARNVAFFGVPFKFRTVSTKDILKARALAETYQDGTPEERLNRAMRELRDARGAQYVANAATRSGMVVLRLPQDGESGEQYTRMVLERLNQFFSSERVTSVAGHELDVIRQAITEALTPPKKKRRSA